MDWGFSLPQKAVLYSNLGVLDKKASIKSKKNWCLFACMKKGCTFAFRKCRRKTSVFLQHRRIERQIVYTIIEIEEKNRNSILLLTKLIEL